MENQYNGENEGKSQPMRRHPPGRRDVGPAGPVDETMRDKAMEDLASSFRDLSGVVSESTPWVVKLLRCIVVLVFGTLMAIRLFFPVRYVVDEGITHSHTDGITTLLHALGIAVVFSVLMYFLRACLRRPFMGVNLELS